MSWISSKIRYALSLILFTAFYFIVLIPFAAVARVFDVLGFSRKNLRSSKSTWTPNRRERLSSEEMKSLG